MKKGIGIIVAATSAFFSQHSAAKTDYLKNGSIRLWDQTSYSKGSYLAFAAPWCAYNVSSLTIGKDVVDAIELNPANFPKKVTILAKVPKESPTQYNCGTYGYNFVAFGNYHDGNPKVPIAPMQVATMREVHIDYAIAHRGWNKLSSYNILQEFYLTRDAGSHRYQPAEIGFFHHAAQSTVAFAKRGQRFADYVDPWKKEWEVYRVQKFIMLLPKQGNLNRGQIELRHCIMALKDRGLINDKWWFNGIAMGMEPITGTTKLLINKWNVTVK